MSFNTSRSSLKPLIAISAENCNDEKEWKIRSSPVSSKSPSIIIQLNKDFAPVMRQGFVIKIAKLPEFESIERCVSMPGNLETQQSGTSTYIFDNNVSQKVSKIK